MRIGAATVRGDWRRGRSVRGTSNIESTPVTIFAWRKESCGAVGVGVMRPDGLGDCGFSAQPAQCPSRNRTSEGDSRGRKCQRRQGTSRPKLALLEGLLEMARERPAASPEPMAPQVDATSDWLADRSTVNQVVPESERYHKMQRDVGYITFIYITFITTNLMIMDASIVTRRVTGR